MIAFVSGFLYQSQNETTKPHLQRVEGKNSRKRSQRRCQKPKQTRIHICRPLSTQYPPLPHQRIKRRPRLQPQRRDLCGGVAPRALPVQGSCYFAVDDLADDQAGKVGDGGERALVAHDVEVGDPAFVALVGLVRWLCEEGWETHV